VSPGRGSTVSRDSQANTVAALQAALSAENAAVFGYGVAGAHLAGPQRAAAQRDWVAHQTARDTLTGMLTAAGAQPAPAAAAYALPFAVHDARGAVELAALIEDRVTAAYLGVVALTGPALRDFGARQVRTAALRAAGWRGASLAFPGMEQPAPAHGGRTGGPAGGPGSGGPASGSSGPGSSGPGGSTPGAGASGATTPPPPTGPAG
jgi:hypothetical protein